MSLAAVPAPRATVTATVAQRENIAYYRTPYWVVWLTDLRTSTGPLPGRAYLPLTTRVAALDLQPGDQVQVDAEVRPNTALLPKGMFAASMRARRPDYWLRRPTNGQVLVRACAAD